MRWAGPAGVLVTAAVCACASLPADELAGRYAYQFENALVDGETYQSTNRITLVPDGPDSSYVSADLEFFNGHLCSIEGIALKTQQGYRLTLPDPANRPAPCALDVIVGSDEIALSDPEGRCHGFCGARGSFNRVRFDRKSRTPIDVQAFLKSSAYAEGRAASGLPPR